MDLNIIQTNLFWFIKMVKTIDAIALITEFILCSLFARGLPLFMLHKTFNNREFLGSNPVDLKYLYSPIYTYVTNIVALVWFGGCEVIIQVMVGLLNRFQCGEVD